VIAVMRDPQLFLHISHQIPAADVKMMCDAVRISVNGSVIRATRSHSCTPAR